VQDRARASIGVSPPCSAFPEETSTCQAAGLGLGLSSSATSSGTAAPWLRTAGKTHGSISATAHRLLQPQVRTRPTAHRLGLPRWNFYVLAVDDDPDARELVRSPEQAGAEVTVTRSVAEAISSIAARVPDRHRRHRDAPGHGFDFVQQLRATPAWSRSLSSR
jgi:hypothetical protein